MLYDQGCPFLACVTTYTMQSDPEPMAKTIQGKPMTIMTGTTERGLDESQLVREANRDPRKFDQLYRRYIARLYRYVYSRVGNAHDAEDITSQTFLAALENINRLRDGSHFASWLFSIARNKINDHYRKSMRLSWINEEMDPGQARDSLSSLQDGENLAILRQAISRLSEEDRELLRLRSIAGLPFSEIGMLQNRSEGAAKKAYYRLKDRLQVYMENENE